MHELHDTTVTSDVTSALNYKQGIERQLSSVDFFADNIQTSYPKNVPLTNSCSESNFGKPTCIKSDSWALCRYI